MIYVPRSARLERVSGELIRRPILPITTFEATEQRFPNACGARKTFQSADLMGHKPKQGIVSGDCFAEFVEYTSEEESLKCQAATGV